MTEVQLTARERHWILLLLVVVVVVRLATLPAYPLLDPTESRYAEIARKMLETGNWLVPQVDYGVPFWGKPPLSIWLSAAAMAVLGVNEFAARLPDRMRLSGFTTKRILREAVRGLLPESILTRKKMGFPVPFAGWVAARWHSAAREVLLDQRTRERGVLDPVAVEHLLDAHRAGIRRGGDAIWALMNLELWYRTFIDQEGIQTLPHAHPVAEIGSAAAA